MFTPRGGGRGADRLTPTRVYTNPPISNLVPLCHHYHANNDDSRRRGRFITNGGTLADQSKAAKHYREAQASGLLDLDSTPPWARNNGGVSPRETVNKINMDQWWHKHTQTQQHSSPTDDATDPADGNNAYAGHYQHYMPPSMRQSTAENPLSMEQFDTPPGYRKFLPYESYVDNWGASISEDAVCAAVAVGDDSSPPKHARHTHHHNFSMPATCDFLTFLKFFKKYPCAPRRYALV